jgi:hypothetical protein
MGDFFDKIGTNLLLWGIENPALIGGIVAYFVVASSVINGLRTAYPDDATRPRWVRFTLGFLDLTCLNFWTILRKFIPGVQGPRADLTASIRDAEKP